jgi:hypothetical protein
MLCRCPYIRESKGWFTVTNLSHTSIPNHILTCNLKWSFFITVKMSWDQQHLNPPLQNIPILSQSYPRKQLPLSLSSSMMGLCQPFCSQEGHVLASISSNFKGSTKNLRTAAEINGYNVSEISFLLCWFWLQWNQHTGFEVVSVRWNYLLVCTEIHTSVFCLLFFTFVAKNYQDPCQLNYVLKHRRLGITLEWIVSPDANNVTKVREAHIWKEAIPLFNLFDWKPIQFAHSLSLSLKGHGTKPAPLGSTRP